MGRAIAMILATLLIVAATEREATRTVTVEIGEVHCADCLSTIRTGLGRMPDVRSLDVRPHADDPTIAFVDVVLPETAELDGEVIGRFLRGFEMRAATVSIRGEIVVEERGPVLVARGSGQRLRMRAGASDEERELFATLAAGPAIVTGRLGERSRLTQDLIAAAWRRPRDSDE